MELTTHDLDGPWSPYVQSLFHYTGYRPDHAIERVVPTGHVFVLFALDGHARHLHDNATLATTATVHDVWVAGVHRNHISISAHPDSTMVVLQFVPWGTHPFLHHPVVDLADRVVAADTAFDGTLAGLHRRVVDAPSVAAMFTAVEQWLDARFDPDATPPAVLVDVVRRLLAAPAARFGDVVADYPHSSKHLASQFTRYVGLTPKAFHRMARFQSILQRVQGGEEVPWGDIAYDTGFADQSHFVREFRHFSGFSPTEFRGLGGDDDRLNFFTLDRDAVSRSG